MHSAKVALDVKHSSHQEIVSVVSRKSVLYLLLFLGNHLRDCLSIPGAAIHICSTWVRDIVFVGEAESQVIRSGQFTIEAWVRVLVPTLLRGVGMVDRFPRRFSLQLGVAVLTTANLRRILDGAPS